MGVADEGGPHIVTLDLQGNIISNIYIPKEPRIALYTTQIQLPGSCVSLASRSQKICNLKKTPMKFGYVSDAHGLHEACHQSRREHVLSHECGNGFSRPSCTHIESGALGSWLDCGYDDTLQAGKHYSCHLGPPVGIYLHQVLWEGQNTDDAANNRTRASKKHMM